MKIYTVRKALANAATLADIGASLSIWQTYAEATKEVDRLYYERSIESYITRD